MSEDPITNKYPELTPYQFASNSPIAGIDLDGLEFYYTASGALLMKNGNSTQVRVVNDDFVKNNYGKRVAIKDINANSRDVGMTNDELNMRAMLTVMKNHEGGPGEGGYYTWSGGEKFTDTKNHPGISPKKGKQAAGAFQIQKNSWEDKYTGEKYKSRYGISDFTPVSQEKFTIATIKDKGSVKAYDEITSGDFKAAMSKMSNEWRFLPGPKTQSETITTEQLMGELKIAIAGELNDKSDLKTPKGTILNDFKSKP